jgi:magnesium transporter
MESPAIWAIEFDFDHRVDRPLAFEEISSSLAKGLCCWVDIDLRHCPAPETHLQQLGLNEIVVAGILSGESSSRYSSFDDCIHVYVTEPRPDAKRLEFSRVELIFADRLFITVHRDEVRSLTQARQNYRGFFRGYAQSLGFLAFECWDGLIDSYQSAFVKLEEEVEGVREMIRDNLDEEMFAYVSELTRDLLRLRRNVIADRETLQQLAIHKSGFVSKTTQPYLAKMAGTMDRLSSDVAIEREILNETLTLYLGIMTHRTNQILSRLTVISVIFLPLTFLVGLYGMNFESQPEFRWAHGYAFFWGIAVVILLGSMWFIRAKRWF